jgi:hypothetical protein
LAIENNVSPCTTWYVIHAEAIVVVTASFGAAGASMFPVVAVNSADKFAATRGLPDSFLLSRLSPTSRSEPDMVGLFSSRP